MLRLLLIQHRIMVLILPHDFTWFIPFYVVKDWGQSQWGISQSFHMAIFWLQKTLILLCQTMMDWPVWIYTSHIHKSLVHTCLDMMASISTTQQRTSWGVAQYQWHNLLGSLKVYRFWSLHLHFHVKNQILHRNCDSKAEFTWYLTRP